MQGYLVSTKQTMATIIDLNLTESICVLYDWFGFQMINNYAWCHFNWVLRELEILGSTRSSRFCWCLKPLWLGLLQLVCTYIFTVSRHLCLRLLWPDCCPLFLSSWNQNRVTMLGRGGSRVLRMILGLKFHACFRWSGEEIGDNLVLLISKRGPCSVYNAWGAS